MSGHGSSYALAYDALGRRVKRTLNGTTIYYTYDGSHPIYEWKADGTRAGLNLYGQGVDEILLRGDYQVLSNGQGYFFQQNRLGSVTQLTGFRRNDRELSLRCLWHAHDNEHMGYIQQCAIRIRVTILEFWFR